MAKITARINGSEILSLARWNSEQFSNESKLYIQSSDLNSIIALFTEVESIEVFVSGNIVKTTTEYDGYSSITFLGKQFVEGENIFTNVMEVGLTKADLVSQVRRLDEQINPVVDIDSMTLEELRTYVLKSIQEQAQAKIFDGTNVALADGTYPHFTYKLEDQTLTSSMSLIIVLLKSVAPDLDASLMLPYHSTNEECKLYSVPDIMNIYATLQTFLSEQETYANMLNAYVRSIQDVEELKSVSFGMDLPKEYQDKYDQIVQAITAIKSVVIKYLTATGTEETPAVEETETSEQ